MTMKVAVIGSQGRMSLEVQKVLHTKDIPYTTIPSKTSGPLSFEDYAGVIDFSNPEASLRICRMVADAKKPYVCGTTGWSAQAEREREQLFRNAALKIPIVIDANFSRGIEIFCEIAELIAQKLTTKMGISDFHHEKKKDTPSGTALKIKDRILKSHSASDIEIRSFRLGDIPGEHRLVVSFEDQVLEVQHRSQSRRPFAEGAYSALVWAQNQKPGLYTMKDVLQ